MFIAALDQTPWHTHTHTHIHSVGLLWTRDQFVAETSTWQHTTLTTDRQTDSRTPAGFHIAIPVSEWAQTHANWLYTKSYSEVP